jgi:hypothetical protein
MIKTVLQSISGVEVYSIISLVAFIAAFTLVLIKVISLKKKDVMRYSLLPLEDSPPAADSTIPQDKYPIRGGD